MTYEEWQRQLSNTPSATPSMGLSVPQNAPMALKAVEDFKKKSNTFQSGGEALSSAGDAAATGGLATANPALALGGLGLQAAGLGLQAYGGYKSREAAQEAEEKANARYEQEWARMQELDAERKAQQAKANEMAYGEYASGQQIHTAQLYGQSR